MYQRRLALGVNNCRPAEKVIAAVEEAERLGAEVAFISEDVNCRDAFQLAAVSAGRTERIRLATGVVNPYTRNPTSLAMAIATLDEVSGGRAILGLGTSSPSLIVDQMGGPPGGTVRVMQEATEIVRGLLQGDTVTYGGERFRYQEATLEVRPVQAGVPIFFAAMGPQMLRLAGRLADGVLLNVGASVEYVRWAVEQIRRGEDEVGRSGAVTVAAWLAVYLGRDRSVSVQNAREMLASMFSVPRQGEILLDHAGGDPSILPLIRGYVSAYPHRGDIRAAAALIPPHLAERLTLIGSPEQVAGRIDEYRAAGVQLPVVGISALRALLGT